MRAPIPQPIPSDDPAIDAIGKRIVSRYEALRKFRAPHEEEWEMIARYLRPQRRGFAGDASPHSRGNRMAGIYNSEPIAQLQTAANTIYSTITNPASQWIVGRPADPELREDPGARAYAEMIVSERILPSFRPAVSPFYSNVRQFYLDYVAFGNGLMYDELKAGGRGIEDRCVSIAETVFAADPDGTLVEVIRKYTLTGAQAVKIFGMDALPKKIVEAADKADAHAFTFYHAVRERAEGETRGMPFLSTHVCELGQTIVKNGGYQSMPFQHGAYDLDTGEIWGRGPGFVALGSARVLNLIERSILEAGQRAANPPVMAAHEKAFRRNMTITPGAVLYGALAGNRPLLQPLDTTGNIGLTMEMSRQRIEEIDIALNTTSTKLANRTGITPEEAMEQQQQRLQALAPVLGGLQNRFLAPKIARRSEMLNRARQMPPPPEYFRGKAIEVSYTSTTALAEKAGQGVATMRLIAAMGNIVQFDPTAAKRLSTDDAMEVLQDAYGAPARVLVPREVAQAAAQAEREQAQLQQAVGLAEQGAGAAEKLARAQSAGQVAA